MCIFFSPKRVVSFSSRNLVGVVPLLVGVMPGGSPVCPIDLWWNPPLSPLRLTSARVINDARRVDLAADLFVAPLLSAQHAVAHLDAPGLRARRRAGVLAQRCPQQRAADARGDLPVRARHMQQRSHGAVIAGQGEGPTRRPITRGEGGLWFCGASAAAPLRL